MAPEPCQEAGEAREGALSSLANEEAVSGHLSPPAGTPAGLVAPRCLKDTKASSTRVDLRSVPESLDPRTLRLLLRQRELEIQGLRCAIQNQRDARHCHALQEVAGFPPESQDRLWQTQVQKLTLELKEQKEQAKLEQERLEEQLLQTKTLLQQREAELQAVHRSCLLKLAQSSWVGRMLRSSTGSVEVVTAETLMDLSDSENEEAAAPRESLRLEDVDWNAIAHRYPNLFANIKSTLDYKHPWPRTPLQPRAESLPDECGSESGRRQHHIKSVEWSSLPFGDPPNSSIANSDSSSCWLDARLGARKVSGHPPRVPGHISFQNIVSPPARSFSRDSKTEPEEHCRPVGLPGDVPSECSIWKSPSRTGPSEQEVSLGLCETHSDLPRKTADDDRWPPARKWSKTGSCLKIVAVSLREGFVCILNESTEETADLGGFSLQRLVGDFPVCTYRFPPETLLEPQHYLTVHPALREPVRPRPAPRARRRPRVWSEGPVSTKSQPLSSVGRQPVHFRLSPSSVTLLLSPDGEVFSKHQAPHRAIPVSGVFDDNADLSIDRFPVSEAQAGADAREQRRPPRPPRRSEGREARSRSRRPGSGPRIARSPPPPKKQTSLRPDRNVPDFRRPRPLQDARETPTSPGSCPRACSLLAGRLEPSRPHRPSRTRALSSHLTTSELFRPQEVPAPPARAETDDAEELPPAIPKGRPGLVDCRARGEPRIRVCRKSVDRGCPMVALSVQSMAESRLGCRFPGCPPITADTGGCRPDSTGACTRWLAS